LAKGFANGDSDALDNLLDADRGGVDEVNVLETAAAEHERRRLSMLE